MDVIEWLVSKETVLSHLWRSETLKFCIKQVDKGQVCTETRVMFQELTFRSDEGLTLEVSASLSLDGGNLTFINLFDTKF